MKKVFFMLMFLITSLFATIDINKATLKELMTLPGIGKVKAQAIIKYRQKHPFKNIDDLKNVKGIGPKLFNKIKNQIILKKMK